MLEMIEQSYTGSLRWIDQHRQLLLRVLTVAGVLLISAYLARRPSILYLMLIPGAALVVILARWPPLGLVGIIVGGLVVPFGIGTGSETQLNPPSILLIVLLGLWGVDVMLQRDIRLLPSRTILPLVALVIVALLSLGVGQLSWFITSPAPIRAQLGGLAIYLLSAGAFLVTAHLVKDLRWLEWMTWVLMALGGLYIVGQMVPGVGQVTDHLFQLSTSGSLFWTWLVALAASQAAFNRRMQPFWRLALGLLVVSALFTSLVLKQEWVSGWAPSLVALVVILWVGSPRLALPVTLVGAILVALRAQSLIGFVNVGDNAYSAMTRQEAWRILYEIVKVSPILGLGPANYYWYTPLFPILGYHVRFNSHNNYVDLIAQTGLLGLVCFLWFFWEVGRLGWRLRSRVPEGFAQAYVYGVLGGLAGTLAAAMLGDWVIPFVYNVGFAGFRASVLGWLFLGGLVAMEQITLHSQSN